MGKIWLKKGNSHIILNKIGQSCVALNRSPGGHFVKHSCMILSNIRNIDQSDTFFVITLNLDQ